MSVHPTETGNLVIRPTNGEVFEAVIVERDYGDGAPARNVVQFYDKSHGRPHQEVGQFVAEYYAEHLLAHPVAKGLVLHGGVPQWVIDGDTMASVLAWVRLSLREEPVAVAVGLPVIVTVHPNGQVTFAVDTSEASEGIREEMTDNYDEVTLDAAAAMLDAVWDEHTRYFTFKEA